MFYPHYMSYTTCSCTDRYTPHVLQWGVSVTQGPLTLLCRMPGLQVEDSTRMSYEYLVYDTPESGVARITLNRPEVLNALNLELLSEIRNAAAEAAQDEDVAVLIYRGSGRSFSVGRDFKQSAELQTSDSEGWFAWRRRNTGVGTETWTHPKATIAQVRGYALGAGHNLAVSCDITIASSDSIFGYPEARFGVLGGRSHLWNDLIGPKSTKEYLFTGRLMPADVALRLGLVNTVVHADNLEDYVLEMARDIAAMERRNPGYIRMTKLDVNYQHPHILTSTTVNPQVLERYALEAEMIERVRRSQEEFFERVAADGMEKALEDLHGDFSDELGRKRENK
jgi:enoyl-CoA hydratase/carnithine racemase